MTNTRQMVAMIAFASIGAVSFVGAHSVVGCACEPAETVRAAPDPIQRGLEPAWWERVRVTTSDATIDATNDLAAGDEWSADTSGTEDEPGSPPDERSEVREVVVTTYEVPADVVFDTDSSELTPEGRATLIDLVPELEGAISVLVAGCTDPRGTSEHNQVLSGDRATSVESVLVDEGIDQDVITTEAWADSRLIPQLPGQDREEWLSVNRRVVIAVTKLADG